MDQKNTATRQLTINMRWLLEDFNISGNAQIAELRFAIMYSLCNTLIAGLEFQKCAFQFFSAILNTCVQMYIVMFHYFQLERRPNKQACTYVVYKKGVVVVAAVN